MLPLHAGGAHRRDETAYDALIAVRRAALSLAAALTVATTVDCSAAADTAAAASTTTTYFTQRQGASLSYTHGGGFSLAGTGASAGASMQLSRQALCDDGSLVSCPQPAIPERAATPTALLSGRQWQWSGTRDSALHAPWASPDSRAGQQDANRRDFHQMPATVTVADVGVAEGAGQQDVGGMGQEEESSDMRGFHVAAGDDAGQPWQVPVSHRSPQRCKLSRMQSTVGRRGLQLMASTDVAAQPPLAVLDRERYETSVAALDAGLSLSGGASTATDGSDADGHKHLQHSAARRGAAAAPASWPRLYATCILNGPASQTIGSL